MFRNKDFVDDRWILRNKDIFYCAVELLPLFDVVVMEERAEEEENDSNGMCSRG